MPRHVNDSEDDEPLEDLTAALTLKNKKTERGKRKATMRQQKRDAIVNLTKLPTEMILECLAYLEPRDVFRFSFVNHRFHSLVNANSSAIGDEIVNFRYNILVRCFPTPKLLSSLEPHMQSLLTDPNRQTQLSIHNRPYQHIQSPNPQELCTCLTCILTWNNLSLALDFAKWQDSLDTGSPITMIPRGEKPEWNETLIAKNARIVRRAVEDSLWHARVLEAHLDSTKRAINRHAKNKGNKRLHIAMTTEEAESGTDSFLTKHGPVSLEFPYHRDEYYILEAYLPNRWWKKNEGRWIYTILGQHERDLEMVQRFAEKPSVALAQLNHVMECIDSDNWMTDVLDYKTYMVTHEVERAESARQPLKYYAAIV